MRRAMTLSAVLGLFVAGLGCHHVAGKCDCTYNPADFPLPTPNQPYAAYYSPMVGGKAAAPAEPDMSNAEPKMPNAESKMEKPPVLRSTP